MKDVNVPAGYKSTDVGVIPENWKVKIVEEIAPLQRGFDLPDSQLQKGKYPVVYSNGVLNYHIEYKAKAPGVVTGRSGTIGKVTYIEENYFPHNTTLWVTDFKSNYPLFIYYLYKNIRLERFGSGSGVPTLNRNDVHSFKVPLPPLPEQKAIARVLSDIDELIRECDSLLAKKRDIKQGTMQQLLTGKKRLPGFSGEWEVKCFNSFAYLSKSRINPQYATKSYLCIELEHLSQDTGRLLGFIESKEQLSQKSVFSRGDVLFGKLRPYLKKFYFTKFSGVCSSEIWVIKSLDNAIGEFIFYLVHSNKFLESANQTSGTKMPRSDWKIVSADEYFLPTLPEQKAIAEILSDMDAEIEALEQKRDKYKAIKQGMMQELLTGKTRLIENR